MDSPSQRVIVITGASGGIGQATASRLAGPGTTLCLQAFQRIEMLEQKSEEYRKKGSRVFVFQADLSLPEAVCQFFEQVVQTLEQERSRKPGLQLTGWINAAGVDLMSPEMKRKNFEQRLSVLMAVDVGATVRLSRLAGSLFCSESNLPTSCSKDDLPVSNRGIFLNNDVLSDNNEVTGETVPTIINFGWDGVERGMEGETAQLYALAKGAVLAFSRSLAQELAPRVRVNTISPGWIRTTWGEQSSQAARRRGCQESLAERWGTPQEVASVVRFLLSAESSYLNDQNLVLNGGFNYRRR